MSQHKRREMTIRNRNTLKPIRNCITDNLMHKEPTMSSTLRAGPLKIPFIMSALGLTVGGIRVLYTTMEQ